MRGFVGIISLCVAVSLMATGCGGAGRKSADQPAWVKKVNALCKGDDRKIASAEGTAGFEVVFSAFTMSRIDKELKDLEDLHPPQLYEAYSIAVDGRNSALSTSDPRRIDAKLLRAQATAAAKGVHCSFGAVPLRKIQ